MCECGFVEEHACEGDAEELIGGHVGVCQSAREAREAELRERGGRGSADGELALDSDAAGRP